MEKVSIIVSVYNVERYLRTCLNSLVNQTFREIEILLINDGSIDDSLSICKEYQEKDKRISIYEQENRGVSQVRNLGIEKAKGTYILFVDGDDYIEDNAVEQMYNNIISSGADMVTCGIYNVYQGAKTPQYEKVEQFLTSGEEAYRLILIGDKIPGSICNKMMKKSILQGLRFPVGRHYEDAYFHSYLMPKINTVMVDTTPLYYYVHRAGSITTRAVDPRSYDVIDAYMETLKAVERYFPALRDVAKFRIIWAYFVIFDRILQQEAPKEMPYFKEIKNFLKRSVVSIVFSKYFYSSRKIGACVLFVHYKLYKKLLVLNEKKNRKIIE